MAKSVQYRMKENWHVKVTAKKEGTGGYKEPTFKFELQVSATYTFQEINKLVKSIVQDRLGNYWNVTDVSLEMVGGE